MEKTITLQDVLDELEMTLYDSSCTGRERKRVAAVAEYQLMPFFDDAEYTAELLDSIGNMTLFRQTLLNGAESWRAWSWGGCGIVYTIDLCDWWGVDCESLDEILDDFGHECGEWLLDKQAAVARYATDWIHEAMERLKDARGL